MNYKMGKSTRGILQELNNHVPHKNRDDAVEARAQHVISSAMHLLELINETYSEDQAEQLTKRFLSSIKGQDPTRFTRMIKKIKESK